MLIETNTYLVMIRFLILMTCLPFLNVAFGNIYFVKTVISKTTSLKYWRLHHGDGEVPPNLFWRSGASILAWDIRCIWPKRYVVAKCPQEVRCQKCHQVT